MKEFTHIKTTVKAHESLKKLCLKYGLTQVDFIESAIKYFKDTGINPTEPSLSPKDEISVMNKRLNQVIAFQKKFENDYFFPAAKDMRDNAKVMNESAMLMKTELNKANLSISESTKIISSNINKGLNSFEKEIASKLERNVKTSDNNLNLIIKFLYYMIKNSFGIDKRDTKEQMLKLINNISNQI